jgi:hypothetical protein
MSVRLRTFTARQALPLIVVLAVASCACETTMLSPSATANPDTEPGVFSSTVVPGGGASRTFDVSAPGSVALTLTSTTPSGAIVGMGVGIPRGDGSCALQASVHTAAGAAAQISIAADTGTYCAKVYDPGTLSASVPFTISISRP